MRTKIFIIDGSRLVCEALISYLKKAGYPEENIEVAARIDGYASSLSPYDGARAILKKFTNGAPGHLVIIMTFLNSNEFAKAMRFIKWASKYASKNSITCGIILLAQKYLGLRKGIRFLGMIEKNRHDTEPIENELVRLVKKFEREKS